MSIKLRASCQSHTSSLPPSPLRSINRAHAEYGSAGRRHYRSRPASTFRWRSVGGMHSIPVLDAKRDVRLLFEGLAPLHAHLSRNWHPLSIRSPKALMTVFHRLLRRHHHVRRNEPVIGSLGFCMQGRATEFNGQIIFRKRGKRQAR